MRVEEEVNIADMDVLIDAVNLHHGIAQDEVGRGIPSVEEVFLGLVLVDRSIDFQRIGIDGIVLPHLGHHILAVQSDPGIQGFGVPRCGHEGEDRRIDMGGDIVVVHIHLAELEVSVDQHLLKSALEVVGRQLDVGMLQISFDALPHLGIQFTGSERNVGAFLSPLLGRGGQGQAHIEQRCRGMDGIHVEGEAVDPQVSLGRKAVQIVVVKRLHQLLHGEVSRQVKVGATVEFDVFGHEALDVRQRHVAFHFEFQPDVAQ